MATNGNVTDPTESAENDVSVSDVQLALLGSEFQSLYWIYIHIAAALNQYSTALLLAV